MSRLSYEQQRQNNSTRNTLLTSETCTYLYQELPRNLEAKILLLVLTLGFLEVVEMEYDEGSE